MPAGFYVRTKKHRKEFIERMHTPEAIRKRIETKRKRTKKIIKKNEENKPEDNKYDSTADRIDNLDREELEDLLAKTRKDILVSVKRLGHEYKNLMGLQAKRDKIEERFEEVGRWVGSLESKAGRWKKGKYK
jgi:hypothetical protein